MEFAHLRLLAIFATVVETQSFAAASRHLHSSRSRISEQVSQLETAIGVRLLQRSTRQLVLTREGKRVYEKAKLLPELLKTIESIVTTTEPQGRVVITMNHDFAHKFLLPALESFQTRYPLVSLDLRLDDDKSDLIANQIDLGIRIGLPKDDSLVGRILNEERFSIFASPEYLAKHGTPKTVKQLEKCRWILLRQYDTAYNFRQHSKNETIHLQREDYYHCDSPLMMQKMVEAGLGVGALLPCMVRDEIANKSLVPLMSSLTTEPLIISLVYPSRINVPQRTRVLIDFLLEANLFEQ